VHQGLSAGGAAVVDLRLRLGGAADGVLRVRIAGEPTRDGGVLMERSAVTLGPRSAPGELQGRIVMLRDSTLEALVGSSGGRAVRLHVELALSPGNAQATVTGRPVSAGEAEG
jgi:hypothetical protein